MLMCYRPPKVIQRITDNQPRAREGIPGTAKAFPTPTPFRTTWSAVALRSRNWLRESRCNPRRLRPGTTFANLETRIGNQEQGGAPTEVTSPPPDLAKLVQGIGRGSPQTLRRTQVNAGLEDM